MDANDAAPGRLNLWGAIRAHWVGVLCITLLFGAAGAAASILLPQQYAATTSVLLQPLDGNPYSPTAQGSDLTNLETEAQVISSDVITQQVAEELPPEFDDADLSKGLTVGIAPNTQIVQVTYRSSDPDLAEAASQQFAESFLDYRSERRDTFLDNRRTSLSDRISELTDRLRELRQRNLDNDDPEVRSVGGQLLNLRLQLAALETGDASPSGEVIVTPVARISGVVLPLLPALIASLLIGLFVGCTWAVLRDRRQNLLRTVDDVERLGLPVLGHVGSAKLRGAAEVSPSDAALMVGAVLNQRVQKPATIAVGLLTSSPGHERFSVDLAQALAQGQQGVLLVDAVGPGPSQQPGLSEALAGNGVLSTLTKRVSGGYARMAVGKKPDTAERLYGTARMDALLEKMTTQFEWVIVRSGTTDQTVGRALVGTCRYWIPLVMLGSTSRDDVERGLVWARTTGTQALGVVAVDRPSRRERSRSAPDSDDE